LNEFYVVVRNSRPAEKPTIVLLPLFGSLPMNTMLFSSHSGSPYVLRFESLADPGRGLAFPCDAAGQVNLDALSDAARRNYLYARAVVGREFHMPQVQSIV
jgi:hypothetical protein